MLQEPVLVKVASEPEPAKEHRRQACSVYHRRPRKQQALSPVVQLAHGAWNRGVELAALAVQ